MGQDTRDRLRAWFRHIPDKKGMRALWLRAAGRKAPASAAIKAKCRDCMGWDGAEVRHCVCPTCPLFCYRSGMKNDVAVKEVIRLVDEMAAENQPPD